MAVITLQLGQCGNQTGRQLFSTLHEDAVDELQRREASPSGYCEASLARFFDADGARRGKSAGTSNVPRARAVLVDMESKAVHQTLAEAGKTGCWAYDPSCVYTQKRGSGNNWASGYHVRGPAARDRILEMVQTQAEKCDQLSGFLMLMSVAGGTGSGVGSYLTESLRDHFPTSSIFNAVVWPYTSGEVIVQDYNAMLTTHHLQEASDGIVLLQNDQLQKAASRLLLLKDITLSDLNRIISHSLAGFLQPLFDMSALSSLHGHGVGRFLYDQCLLRDIQTKLCPTTDFKFLSLKSIPQMPERSHAYTRYLWTGLLKHLRQMLLSDSPIEEGMDWSLGREMGTSLFSYSSNDELNQRAHFRPRGINRSLANLLALRGNELDDVDTSIFFDKSLYRQWVPSDFSCSVWCSRHPFNKYEKSCTLLSNSQSCVLPLDTACRKAWDMYSCKAYVHQYLQNGLTQQEMLDAFIAVEQVIKSYATVR